ncbi:MAG: TIGR01212 family radical SAM protein [Lachnospiraceae bacterium]|nr:TIGR01212 family radical SAM protein [Lachnospiraceae bacterium]
MEEVKIPTRKKWGEKRYHSLDYALKKAYGQKIYKLSLNGGMSCPNRDGTIGEHGCIFCSEGGSGDFASSPLRSITEQIEDAKAFIAPKLSGGKDCRYIAYFQAYTNTYAPVSYLEKIFTEALSHPEIVLLSIATRPDCLGEEVLTLLARLNKKKPVLIELGLQTMHPRSAEFIRRGYPLSCFEEAVTNLHALGIPVIVHSILGLPGETREEMFQTMDYLAGLPIQGIKLQLLHILKGTDLGDLYENGRIKDILSLDEYIDLVISCLERLPQDIVIHRITGDGPGKLLLAPLWSKNKKLVLNSIHKQMKLRDSWQGKECKKSIKYI